MRAYIRDTRGVSWPDRRYPGVRHWRSQSIAVGGFWYGIGWLLWYGAVWPFFIIPAWITVEIGILMVSLVIAGIAVLTYDRSMEDVYLDRIGPFWYFDLWMP